MKNIKIPNIKQVFPKLVPGDLVNVQPVSKPAGNTFKFDVKYEEFYNFTPGPSYWFGYLNGELLTNIVYKHKDNSILYYSSIRDCKVLRGEINQLCDVEFIYHIWRLPEKKVKHKVSDIMYYGEKTIKTLLKLEKI